MKFFISIIFIFGTILALWLIRHQVLLLYRNFILHYLPNKKIFPLYNNDDFVSAQVSANSLKAIQQVKALIATSKLNLVETTCICGSVEGECLLEKDRYGFFVPSLLCHECSMVRSKFIFDEEGLITFYQDFYRAIYSDGTTGVAALFKGQEQQGKGFLKRLTSLGLIDNIKTIFEIGAGAGGILKPFSDAGKKVAGCDFDQEYIAFGRNAGIELFRGDFKEFSRELRNADLIIMSHVLEHLVNPLKSLQEIEAFLKKGSYLFIQVPGIFNMEGYGDPILYFQNAHVFNFHEQYLKTLLKAAGFSIIFSDENCNVVATKTCTELGQITPQVFQDLAQHAPRIKAYIQQIHHLNTYGFYSLAKFISTLEAALYVAKNPLRKVACSIKSGFKNGK